MTDPKASISAEEAIDEVASRLDEVGDEGIQYASASGASEYLQDRAKNVDTWDGDNG
jgi:hypothetical protein